MKQPQVARLELGEMNPSTNTLVRIASRLGIEFTIDVRPAGAPARNVTKQARTVRLVGTFRGDDAELLRQSQPYSPPMMQSWSWPALASHVAR